MYDNEQDFHIFSSFLGYNELNDNDLFKNVNKPKTDKSALLGLILWTSHFDTNSYLR